jgi:SAM-dependent methyltransferase
MVYHGRLKEIREANQHMKGKVNYLTDAFKPDNCNAVKMANLQPGERVLDLGIGSGYVLAAAKTAVKDGLCVGIDAVQGFLEVDVPDTLTRAGLAVAPSGTDDTKVYLINENVTNGALAKVIRDRIGLPSKQPLDFNIIFLLNVFNTIPPAQRRQTLQNLKSMLADNGRIVMSASARFGAPHEVQGIVQFSSNDLTEAPGCMVSSWIDLTSSVTIANGESWPKRTIFSSIQLAPDELWKAALDQAVAAAGDVGLHVVSSLDFGKGDQFGLAAAPPVPALGGRTARELISFIINRALEGHDILGPVFEAIAAKTDPQWGQQPPAGRNISCVLHLQRVAEMFITDLNNRSKKKRMDNPHSTEPLTISEHQQVGVLVELRRK